MYCKLVIFNVTIFGGNWFFIKLAALDLNWHNSDCTYSVILIHTWMTFSDMLFSNKNDEQNTNSNVIQLQHSLIVILVLLCILSLDWCVWQVCLMLIHISWMHDIFHDNKSFLKNSFYNIHICHCLATLTITLVSIIYRN